MWFIAVKVVLEGSDFILRLWIIEFGLFDQRLARFFALLKTLLTKDKRLFFD